MRAGKEGDAWTLAICRAQIVLAGAVNMARLVAHPHRIVIQQGPTPAVRLVELARKVGIAVQTSAVDVCPVGLYVALEPIGFAHGVTAVALEGAVPPLEVPVVGVHHVPVTKSAAMGRHVCQRLQHVVRLVTIVRVGRSVASMRQGNPAVVRSEVHVGN